MLCLYLSQVFKAQNNTVYFFFARQDSCTNELVLHFLMPANLHSSRAFFFLPLIKNNHTEMIQSQNINLTSFLFFFFFFYHNTFYESGAPGDKFNNG